MRSATSISKSPRVAVLRADAAILAAFAGTLFLSAFLLFAVQPLLARMVLPRLGGTPAVWSVAMVFFQAVLLCGYGYAHLLMRKAGIRRALLIHFVLMATALAFLPVGIAEGFETPPESGFAPWLLGLFAASIGLPFLAVSANGPLLQAWFARTGHAQAADPYFLYGASNIGSFAALLSYPVLAEPLFTLAEQARIWTVGYVALLVAVTACGGLALIRPYNAAAGAAVGELAEAAPSSWRQRAEWCGWAFLPSGLLVAVTAHISTDIAPAPFFWVVPLAIFLLTYVLAFQRERLIPHRILQLMLPPVAAAAVLTSFLPFLFGVLGGIAVNLFALFVVALVWHGELVARRPAASRLTEFYLFMSIGGVLGGAFASLAAPVLFDSVLEFPLLLVAAALALPEARSSSWRVAASCGAALLVAGITIVDLRGAVEDRERSFFGVITTRTTPDGVFRTLSHGTTLHGAERLSELALRPPARPEPLTYYHAEGPLAQGLAMARTQAPQGRLSVGIVGLGTGSLACYAAPGDSWRFFEIDPAVIRVARDPERFSFLSACAPAAPIIQGDARLTLTAEPNESFDVLVIDAFSSDAIPVHLLTAEALRLYMDKLQPGGVALLHISNTYMDLQSVVAATAEASGIAAVGRVDLRPRSDLQRMWAGSEVVALAQRPADLAPYRAAGWEPLSAPPTVSGWTDDYANIVAAILREQGFMGQASP